VIVFINGAFGIGKSTVASSLRRRLPRSAIFDPELVGFVLRPLPAWVPLAGRGTGDFQDMPSWRRFSILGIRAARAVRENVIVPMAFSNLAYLEQFLRGVERFDPVVRHFCLVAPLPVVLGRLAKRGADLADRDGVWQIRRARECCDAHQKREFAQHVSAEHRDPGEIASEIVDRISQASRDAHALDPS
jgi:hypothetical protein